jgi:Fungal Zn(2)-Cys(6) binuclear cluster domain
LALFESLEVVKMFTQPSDEKSYARESERLKRRPNKKTRTACKTCRIRKVKCDEGKPTCKRCETFGVDCDGYVQPKAIIPPKKQAPPAILPRGVECENVSITKFKPAAKIRIPRVSRPVRDEELSKKPSVGSGILQASPHDFHRSNNVDNYR